MQQAGWLFIRPGTSLEIALRSVLIGTSLMIVHNPQISPRGMELSLYCVAYVPPVRKRRCVLIYYEVGQSAIHLAVTRKAICTEGLEIGLVSMY